MAFTDIPAAGAKLRGSTISALISELRPVTARLTSDVLLTTSSTTLQNVTGLSIAVAANATYEVEGIYVSTGGTAEDIKFAHTFPAGATWDWFSRGLDTALTETQILVVNQGSGTASNYGAAGTGSPRYILWHATLIVGGTAGTLQTQAAQVVSGATQTTVKAGSKLTARRVA